MKNGLRLCPGSCTTICAMCVMGLPLRPERLGVSRPVTFGGSVYKVFSRSAAKSEEQNRARGVSR